MIFFPPLQDVCFYEYALMLKCTFEYCRNLWICKKLLSCTDHLTEASRAVNLNATRKQLPGQQTNFSPLLDDDFIYSVWLRQFRFVNKKVQPFEALDPSYKSRFRDLHCCELPVAII